MKPVQLLIPINLRIQRCLVILIGSESTKVLGSHSNRSLQMQRLTTFVIRIISNPHCGKRQAVQYPEEGHISMGNSSPSAARHEVNQQIHAARFVNRAQTRTSSR